VWGATRARAGELVAADVDGLVLDIAHGRADAALEAVQELKGAFPDVEVVAGNVATGKLVERAKGLLMTREGLSEEDAFARLRRASQVSGRPMRVVAEALIATFVDES